MNERNIEEVQQRNLIEILDRAVASGDTRTAASALEALFKVHARPPLEIIEKAVFALWNRSQTAIQLLREMSTHIKTDKDAYFERKQIITLLHIALLLRHKNYVAADEVISDAYVQITNEYNPLFHSFAAQVSFKLAEETDDDENVASLLEKAQTHSKKALELCNWVGLDECIHILVCCSVEKRELVQAKTDLKKFKEKNPLHPGALRMYAEFISKHCLDDKSELFGAYIDWALVDPENESAWKFVFDNLKEILEHKEDEFCERIAQLIILRLTSTNSWKPWFCLANVALNHPKILQTIKNLPWKHDFWKTLHFGILPENVVKSECSQDFLISKAVCAELLFGKDNEITIWWKQHAIIERTSRNIQQITPEEMISWLTHQK